MREQRFFEVNLESHPATEHLQTSSESLSSASSMICELKFKKRVGVLLLQNSALSCAKSIPQNYSAKFSEKGRIMLPCNSSRKSSGSICSSALGPTNIILAQGLASSSSCPSGLIASASSKRNLPKRAASVLTLFVGSRTSC